MYIPSKKFLWTHPRKSGGTSFRIVLRENFAKELRFDEGHQSLDAIRQQIKNNSGNFNNYFKVSLSRNPWDRVISYWYHQKCGMIINHAKINLPLSKTNFERNETVLFWIGCTFEEFLNSHYIDHCCVKQFYFLKDKYIIDKTIRYENYEQDVCDVLKTLGVTKYNLKRVNHESRRPINDDYRIYYTDETAEFIGKKFSWECEKFGYNFDNGVNKNAKVYKEEIKNRINKNLEKIENLKKQISQDQIKLFKI